MDSLTLASNLALLGTSGCAVLYCAQLSSRLRRLQTEEKGLPKAVATLTAAIGASRASMEEIGTTAHRATAELRSTLAELESRQQAARDLSGLLDGQAAQTERHLAAVREEAETATRRLAKRASLELDALARAMDVVADIRSATEKASPAELREVAGADGEADRRAVRQRPASGPNPFLRAVG